MSDVAERLERLSPERRALLQALLAEEEQQRAAQAERQRAAIALPTIVPAPADRYRPFPATDMQQALWVGRSGALELGQVSGHMYFEADGVDIDIERLERAWQRLIDRHDLLRAIVQPTDGQLRVLPEVPRFRLEVLDLRGRTPDAQAAELEAVRARLSHQVLPADRWPLFEFRASRLDDRRTRIHISFDLLVADAWSFQFLMGQWGELYRDPDKVLPPLEISFRDYRLAELQLEGGELHRRSEEYWRKRLPTLPPRPSCRWRRCRLRCASSASRTGGCGSSPRSWRRLKERAGQAGLTPSGALLAAYAEVLEDLEQEPALQPRRHASSSACRSIRR